jgi:hypothetical protein
MNRRQRRAPLALAGLTLFVPSAWGANSGTGTNTLTQATAVSLTVFGESLGSNTGGKGVHNQF